MSLKRHNSTQLNSTLVERFCGRAIQRSTNVLNNNNNNKTDTEMAEIYAERYPNDNNCRMQQVCTRKTCHRMSVSINGHGDLHLWPFDLETGTRVAYKVGNLPSTFGHARPLGSRIIRYVCDGRTNRHTYGRTHKSNAYCPFLWAGHNKCIHLPEDSTSIFHSI